MDIASIIAPTARLMSSQLFKVLFDDNLQKSFARGRRFVRFNPSAFEDVDEAEADDIKHTNDDSEITSDNSATSDEDLEFSGDGLESPKNVIVFCENKAQINDIDLDFSLSNPDNVIDMDGDAISESSFFSLIWTLAACGFYDVDENIDPPAQQTAKFLQRWKNQLIGSPPVKFQPEDVIAAFYAWRHDSDLWSAPMKAIANFQYRDKMPFLCDVPTEEIGFYSAFAQLSYPAHINIR
jgi:hypothetical protein